MYIFMNRIQADLFPSISREDGEGSYETYMAGVLIVLSWLRDTWLKNNDRRDSQSTAYCVKACNIYARKARAGWWACCVNGTRDKRRCSLSNLGSQ